MKTASVLLSKQFARDYGPLLHTRAAAAGMAAEVVHLPDDPSARLSSAALNQIDVAYLSRDLRFSPHFPAFGATVEAAPNLKWVHFASAGISQHAFLAALIARHVKLTTSAGANAETVAHTAICGLLMLARGFPRWLDAQRRHAWEPMRGAQLPCDLDGQTVLVIGVGGIGGTLGRFCGAMGMRVIGVRRPPAGPAEGFDEMHTLSALRDLLPRADWVVLACPHTPETHHLLNAAALAALPRGAHLVNVARGPVVDEPALIEALAGGRLAGAYLDVFEKEPLPPDSPLWTMQNVLVSPHSASVSAGNERRSAEIFVDNLARWARGEALQNERHA